jgi:ribose 5-phosphate isomerase B
MSDKDNARKLRVAIGSDHAGYPLKEELANSLRDDGYQITDLGTFSIESVDYPDVAVNVASAVSRGDFDRGILICGTGIGVTITANKIKGIRAAATSDVYSAGMARAHNDANVLGMGARVVGPGLAHEIAKAFLDTDFEAGSRHERRVEKINALDGCGEETVGN